MKKSFYILAVIFLVVILVFLLFWFRKDRVINNDLDNSLLEIASDEVIVPVFMTEAEKISYNLSPETQVQVLSRDENGEIMTFKIIKSEVDLITNRKELQIR
ncbi:MAG: hypothetical protein RBT30_00340 [Patescibacteria group bacterium]|jgi:hypothetical protein|nr:hypothetical protein [Patescibacteria group bacterium]